MNTEIQRGLGQSSTLLTPSSPLQGKVDDHVRGHGRARAPSEHNAVVPSTSFKQAGQLVLQTARSAKGVKTMNTGIQSGVVKSATPLAPNQR